jgi:hypothetical protein
MRRGTRWSLLAIGFAASVLALALSRAWLVVPPEWSPWAPLELDHEPNFITRFKLGRLSREPELCASVLASAAMTYRPVPDEVTGPQCGLFDAVTIDRTASAVDAPFLLTCRAAVSLALWEKHAVAPAAAKHLASPVQRLEHFGSYACRNVYGRPNATRSRHATAEAFDVAGFVLADGRRIRVLGDWAEDSAAAHFLHDVRDGACRFFDGVLSPDHNAAHRDHLHLDRGTYRYCR